MLLLLTPILVNLNMIARYMLLVPVVRTFLWAPCRRPSRLSTVVCCRQWQVPELLLIPNFTTVQTSGSNDDLRNACPLQQRQPALTLRRENLPLSRRSSTIILGRPTTRALSAPNRPSVVGCIG